NSGDGLFGGSIDYGMGFAPQTLTLADVNGDGHRDVVAAGGPNGTVLFGNGDGTLAAPRTGYGIGGGSPPRAREGADGDGHPDVVTVNRDTNTVSVLLGNGDATFADRTDYGVGSSPDAVALADLNGDGRPDLVVANEGIFNLTGNGFFANSSVSVLLNNG